MNNNSLQMRAALVGKFAIMPSLIHSTRFELILTVRNSADSEESFTSDSDNEDESQQKCVKYHSVLS